MRTMKAALLAVALCLASFHTDLQAQFGKNKVQYDVFDWKLIQSKNFDVYYYGDGLYLAEYTARVSEQMLEQLEKNFNYRIMKRVPVVVYLSHNEFQQTSVISSGLPEGVGGVTELFKNRVVLPFEGVWDQFHHVIRHELVHAFLNDMFYGGSLQTVVSNNIRTELTLWMNEGLAEYESILGLDTKTDMYMRDITVSEQLMPLPAISGYASYRAGQTFYWYVAEKYGKGKIGELLNRLKNVTSLDAAFKATFNKSLKDFSEEWEKEIKRIYLPDVAKFEYPEDYAERITNHRVSNSFYNTSPALSPNGDQIAYISDQEKFFSIFVMDLKTRKSRMLIKGSRAVDFEELNILTPGISWNPKGDKIAVSAKSGAQDALFIVEAASGDAEKFELGFRTMNSVQWSPDGTTIAFVAVEGAQPDLYLFDVATKAVKKLTNDLFTDKSPIWSPDGKTIYFISDREDRIDGSYVTADYDMVEHNVYASDVYSIDVATGTIRRLTTDSQHEKTSIAVDSQNERLLIVADRNGIGNIWELNLMTGEQKPKTNSLTGITQLALSKDDSKVMFSSQNRGGFDIFMLRFPFEKTVSKELPLTEVRRRLLAKDSTMRELASGEADSSKASEGDSLVGYGAFDIDFSRQKMVRPNPDAVDVSKIPSRGTTSLPGADAPMGSFTPKPYKVEFSPDLIFANGGYDTFWGFQGLTQMLFSDVMGEHQIYFAGNFFMSLTNSRLFLQYSYLKNPTDYSISAFHTAQFVRSSITGNSNLYRYRYYGANMGLSVPFSTFNRLDFEMSMLATASENVDFPQLLSRTLFHAVPTLTYTHDNVRWGMWSPMEGTRYFISASGTPQFSTGHMGFVTTQADARGYIPLGDYTSIAGRVSGAASFGPRPQRFFVGGTDNWLNPTFTNGELPFSSAEDLYFLRQIIPARGFAVNQLNGSKFVSANAEFRFPLIAAIFAGSVPLFYGMEGVIFSDVVGLWDDSFVISRTDPFTGRVTPANLLHSVGTGLRTSFLGFPVRVDVAWQNLYSGFSRPYWLISLGGDW